MVEYFVDLAARAGHWGYLIVFVIVVLECQALLGLFMPGASLVLLSGFLAGRGVFRSRCLGRHDFRGRKLPRGGKTDEVYPQRAELL